MMTIQEMTSTDLMALQRISMQTFKETFADSNTASDLQLYVEQNFSLEKLAAEMANEDSFFYMAMDGNVVIGYLKLNIGVAQTELQESDSVEIERIYVLQEYQGQHVGKMLYERALELAKMQGKTSLWLGVWEFNQKAIKFYEKQGFIAFGTHVFHMGEDPQTDILMRKSLVWD